MEQIKKLKVEVLKLIGVFGGKKKGRLLAAIKAKLSLFFLLLF